jgi:putative thioredoxin
LARGAPVEDQASRLRLRIELLEAAGDVDEAELNEQVTRSPNDLSARWALAGRLLQLGKNEQALEELLEIVRADRKFRDDGARRALLSVFDQLGHDSDLAREFRRRLQIYV